MTPENFCYWLQGWYEVQQTGQMGVPTPTPLQSCQIYNHLQLVFNKVTPDMNFHTSVTTPTNPLKFDEIAKYINVASC